MNRAFSFATSVSWNELLWCQRIVVTYLKFSYISVTRIVFSSTPPSASEYIFRVTWFSCTIPTEYSDDCGIIGVTLATDAILLHSFHQFTVVTLISTQLATIRVTPTTINRLTDKCCDKIVWLASGLWEKRHYKLQYVKRASCTTSLINIECCCLVLMVFWHLQSTLVILHRANNNIIIPEQMTYSMTHFQYMLL